MSSLPPPWENRGPEMLAVQWSLTSLAIVCVAGRVYIRGFLRKNFGWDDAWVVASMVIGLVISALVTLSVEKGFGRHIYYVESTAEDLLKYATIAEILTVPAVAAVKISATVLVLRILGSTARYVRWLLYANMAVFVPLFTAVFFVLCFQCSPLEVLWTELSPPSKCLDRNRLNTLVLAYCIVGAITDAVIAITPVFIIWNLQMPQSRKIALSILVALGLIITICSCLKTQAIAYSDPDSTWALIPVSLWTVAEHMGGIVVASLPPLTPFLGYIGEKGTSAITLLRSRLLRSKQTESDQSLPKYTRSTIDVSASRNLGYDVLHGGPVSKAFAVKATGKDGSSDGMELDEHPIDDPENGIGVRRTVETYGEVRKL